MRTLKCSLATLVILLTSTMATAASESSIQSTHDMEELLILLLILVYCGVMFYGVYLGLTKKAVFFYDVNDSVLSFSPFVAAALTIFFSGGSPGAAIIRYILFSTAGSLFIIASYRTLFYNKFNWTILAPVLLAKIFLSSLAKICFSLFVILKAVKLVLPTGKSSREKQSNRAWDAVVLSFFVSLMKRLINGPEVYEIKGWELPVMVEQSKLVPGE
ncbi:MAG: hypothetical protein HQK60_16065 [Deltaproteobacteria bacterium]|nr:hypothetical protein [Deltaproteobacteria bacterium]